MSSGLNAENQPFPLSATVRHGTVTCLVNMVAVPRLCEMCPSTKPAAAVVYCDADSCFLCAKCDEDVHGANRLAQRHVRRPVAAMDVQPASEESDILVPDVSDEAISRQDGTGIDQDSIEGDAVYADFDEFEGVAFAKMPALTGSESDSFLSIVPSGGLKSFDSDDLSWDAVVPDFEHVVPDVETMSIPHAKSLSSALKIDSSPAGPSLGLPEAHVPVAPVVPVLGTTRPLMKPVAKPTNPKLSSPTMSNVTNPSPTLTKNVNEIDAASTAEASTPNPPKPCFLSPPTSEDDNRKVSSPVPGAPVEEPKTPEQRKQIRLEALARFRAKRANRSFQKKIRYGCRQRLAESRPRVKGRFVRKADMALYRRYGANYADYKGLAEAAVEDTPVASL